MCSLFQIGLPTFAVQIREDYCEITIIHLWRKEKEKEGDSLGCP